MALTLSIGFVVDDAIVMLENIIAARRGRDGAARRPRWRGSKEIGFTIVSMTVSLAAVFIPVLFMGGIVGRLFHEFAVTIVAAILVSGVVSLTLTPMLCSRLLQAASPLAATRRKPRERCSNVRGVVYERTLRWSRSQHPRAMLARVRRSCSLRPPACSSSRRKDSLRATTRACSSRRRRRAPDISFDAMSAKQQRSHSRHRLESERRDRRSASLGNGGSGGLNNGRILVALKPQGERPPADAGRERAARRNAAGFTGLKVYVQNQPALRIGGLSTQEPVPILAARRGLRRAASAGCRAGREAARDRRASPT